MKWEHRLEPIVVLDDLKKDDTGFYFQGIADSLWKVAGFKLGQRPREGKERRMYLDPARDWGGRAYGDILGFDRDAGYFDLLEEVANSYGAEGWALDGLPSQPGDIGLPWGSLFKRSSGI